MIKSCIKSGTQDTEYQRASIVTQKSYLVSYSHRVDMAKYQILNLIMPVGK